MGKVFGPLIIANEDTRLISKMTSFPMLQTPETRLIQYDCGKLQVLAKLLRELQSGGHRALIFTQMTKVLDVLESFLNYHGYTYLRLDGSTKVEQRQVLMERFNANAKYFVFILSTRSGGVGINLTGADTVIFYDSDWNPTMDAQAQDRCHRIGQTRDVHIYRLVSERTIEENILKKANQKRLLGDLAIEGGNFTTAYFKKSTIRDLFDENEQNNEDNTTTTPEITNITEEEEEVSNNANEKTDKRATKAFVSAISAVEDNIDAEALKKASKEVEADEAEFDEEVKPDDGLGTLMKQLSPIETYAFKHVEHIQKFWKECQIAAIDAEIEAQKKEFDEKKLEEMAEAIGAGASATPTEDGSTASETEVDEGDDDSDDEVDDGDSDDGSSDEDEDRVTVDDNDTENTEPTDSDDDSDRENSTAIESEDEKPIKRLKINAKSKFMKKSRKKSKKDSPLSPRTRSRGDVRINLFNLD
jgi:superfamily II DNA/RNA helicase